MDILTEKKKILDIFNEHSIRNQYKKANNKDRFFIFILPVTLTIISLLLIIVKLYNNNILNFIFNIIGLILLLITFVYYDKTYDRYIKGKYYLNGIQNKDVYYNAFKDDLDNYGIKDIKKINLYIDILELDTVSMYNIKPDFFKYFSVICIPVLMIYFNNFFENAKIIACIIVGLFIIPVSIFIIKVLFINRKQIRYDTLLHFLKRRRIELINE